MTRPQLPVGLIAALIAAASACERDANTPPVLEMVDSGGGGQTDTVGKALPAPFKVQLREGTTPRPGLSVTWSVLAGGGSIPSPTMSDDNGIAGATLTLGSVAGTQAVRAAAEGASGSPITFTVAAVPDRPSQITITGGNGQTGCAAQRVPGPLVVLLRDRFDNPTPGAVVEWSVVDGGGAASAAAGTTDASGSARVSFTLGPTAGLNTVDAKSPAIPNSVTFTLTGTDPTGLVATVPIAPNYGIHDTYVRDGLAFVFAWNTGVLIYDVGNGVRNGSPCTPVLVGGVATQNGRAHNGWWFWNPNGQKRYLFVGEEGPGFIGTSSSGAIHVVDVSDLSQPVEVGSFQLSGAGAHNFWMDEANQLLYAAFYNGGVVKLDVSGMLSGSLASRLRANQQPGGPGNTYVWSVQLYNGSLYAIDMLSGLWQLDPVTLATRAGGNNVPERYSSDLWVHGGYAYTGTWGNRSGTSGNALKIWQLDATGAPVLVNSIVTSNITTVSDVEVSTDGKLLLFSTEGGANAGIYLYSLADPAAPTYLTSYLVSSGVHTTTTATINGRRYVFGARNPGSTVDPALLIYDVTSLVP